MTFSSGIKRLIALAESCAKIAELNKLRVGNVTQIASDEIISLYTVVAREHWPIDEKLVSKLKTSREIMARLRSESG
jgi:hypothetical protein